MTLTNWCAKDPIAPGPCEAAGKGPRHKAWRIHGAVILQLIYPKNAEQLKWLRLHNLARGSKLMMNPGYVCVCVCVSVFCSMLTALT